LSGAFLPGAIISMRPLAKDLGVSPMPVREALSRLCYEGALETLPNRGYRVPHISEGTYRELLQIRIRLETMAGEAAAVRADYNQIDRATATYETMAAEGEKMDVSVHSSVLQYMRLHRQFHFSIYSAAGMPELLSMLERLWLRIGPILFVAGQSPLSQFRFYHTQILNAFRAGDASAIASAIREDILDGVELVYRYLAERDHAGGESMKNRFTPK
jgi:DNA-binding GntR family transcriptional regulator